MRTGGDHKDRDDLRIGGDLDGRGDHEGKG